MILLINVVIADDEVSILNGLKNNVRWEEFGMDLVGMASNGQNALELLRQHEADLLITDVCMPGMDGLELISEAKKLRKGIHCVLISAYNEFDYVHRAIHLGIVNYLLKPLNMNELSETLEKVIDNFNREQLVQSEALRSTEVFRENLLNRWVSGGIDHLELCERANLAKINVYAKEYCVITVKMLEHTGGELPEVLKKTEDELRHLLKTVPGIYIFVNAACHIILLIHGNMLKDVIKQIKSCLEADFRAYCRENGIETFIAVGEIVNGSKNVNQSYLSASKLLDYSLLKASAEVLCAGDMKGRLTDKYISAPDFSEFEKMIRAMDLEGCLNFTDILLHRFDRADDIDLPQSKAIIIELLFRILGVVRKAFADNETFPDSFKKLFSEFDSITVFSHLRKWLHRTIEEAIGCIRQKSVNYSPIVNLVLKYLDVNYNRDISIKCIADRFNVNASYLGQIFRKETGKIFSDYLNALRLRHAIQMLSCTQLKVQEIARKVGYSNTSYFNHIFRNEYLVTPVRYRINLLESKRESSKIIT